MEIPTPTQLRSWSRVDFSALGYDDTALAEAINRAVAYVEQVTGRVPLTDAVPPGMEPLARQAVQMRLEQATLQAQDESVEQSTEEGVVSFSTPGYSETRSTPQTQFTVSAINRWPALNDVLWLLMTPEARDAWLALTTGSHAPAFAVTEVDWSPFPEFPSPPGWPGWDTTTGPFGPPYWGGGWGGGW